MLWNIQLSLIGSIKFILYRRNIFSIKNFPFDSDLQNFIHIIIKSICYIRHIIIIFQISKYCLNIHTWFNWIDSLNYIHITTKLSIFTFLYVLSLFYQISNEIALLYNFQHFFAWLNLNHTFYNFCMRVYISIIY